MSPMLEATEKIWMNGTFVKWDDAKVHVLTHTLHYGTGVFEGIRCYKTDSGSAVFRLQEHVGRLFDSAHILQMEIPFTREAVAEAILETIRAKGDVRGSGWYYLIEPLNSAVPTKRAEGKK